MSVFVAAACAADATRPIDPAQRSAPFATGAALPTEKRAPAIDQSVQQKRVTPSTIDKAPAAVGERRAAIELEETREKKIRPTTSQRPATVEQPKSAYDGQRARISTAGDTTKPPLVAKYQDSLAAASASNMARFPATSGKAGTKINRFIFRRNGGELADTPQRATATRAGSGAAPAK